MDHNTNSITYIRENGLTVREIAEKLSMPDITIYRRIQTRAIKPIGKIGNVPIYGKVDFDKIAENIPRGYRSHKNRKPLLPKTQTP